MPRPCWSGRLTIKVATVAWELRKIRSDSEFFGHFYDLVHEAHDKHAQVVVFPELQVLELLHIEPDLKERDVAKYLVQYADAIEEWIGRISDSSGMIIVGGSHFKETPDGIINCCAVGHPALGVMIGAKNNLTSYEQQMWGLARGEGLLRMHDSRMGVTICYDCEFPESGRALAEEGVLIQCVPSFTETQYGFQRVRWSCRARAIENQNYVVHASLLGSLGREPVPSTYGTSAILCPSLPLFPVSGVLAETPLGEEAVAIADLDLGLLDEARETGDVRNWNDRHRSEWRLGKLV
jgi:predicted amidohydrolase